MNLMHNSWHNRRGLVLMGGVLVVFTGLGCKDLPYATKEVDFEERVAEAKPNPGADRTRFALAAMITPQEANRDYRRLVDLLGQKAGQKATLIHGRSYGQVNKQLASGKMEFAFVCTGGFTHPSQDGSGVEVLAAPVVYGVMTYRSYVLVKETSRYRDFAQLAGARFAFTDPLSLTGYLYPHSRVLSLGKDKDSFFRAYTFVGSHDRAITSVRSGAADAAAVDALIFDFIKDRQPELVRDLRVLETSQPFGMPPVVAAPHVSRADRAKWKRALLSLHTSAEGKKLMGRLGMERFGEAESGLYDSAKLLWKTER